MMRPQTWIALGAVLAGLAVAAGALGAHGLEKRLTPDQLETFEVAVRYQMYHAVGLCLVGLVSAQRSSRLLTASGWCFVVGILVFSGLLYAWVFTGVKLFALIVPIGGVAMIVGWFLLAAAGLSRASTITVADRRKNGN